MPEKINLTAFSLRHCVCVCSNGWPGAVTQPHAQVQTRNMNGIVKWTIIYGQHKQTQKDDNVFLENWMPWTTSQPFLVCHTHKKIAHPKHITHMTWYNTLLISRFEHKTNWGIGSGLSSGKLVLCDVKLERHTIKKVAVKIIADRWKVQNRYQKTREPETVRKWPKVFRWG